jgi:cytochrome oxidase Cu insertion factor (SCO1/SenC/PrrC family)
VARNHLLRQLSFWLKAGNRDQHVITSHPSRKRWEGRLCTASRAQPMPGSDTPTATLGPQLLSLASSALLWTLLAAFIAGALCTFRPVRNGIAFQRARELFAGKQPSWRPEPQPRMFLRVSFGLLWILDGLLQARPRMPSGFVADVLGSATTGTPHWFGTLLGPFARAWTRHPVSADAATVFVQVGLGLLILIGGRGLLAKLTLWASILWSAAIWFLGEGFGGLLATGAGWISGAPGAAVCYAAAAGLLLGPRDWWESGRAKVIARRFVAAWLVLAALLQAWPTKQAWTGPGASAPFVNGARTAQPELSRRPIAWIANFASEHPVALNLTIIILLVVIAGSLWLSGNTRVIGAGLVLCAATWWLGQDFGALGPTGTDPNSALPLGLLLASALPARSTRTAPVLVPRAPPEIRGLRLGLMAGLTALAAGLALVVPLVLASTLAGPADAAAVAADSDGGLRTIPGRPAAPFALTDQRNQPVSMSGLRGKLVVLTFLDPVCTSECPLVANQLALADRALGALARQVEFVAIDTNPVFHLVSDVDAFTQSHGLGALPNWHFLCGTPDALEAVLSAYGISVDVPAVGMIQHSEGMYFIGADGRQAAFLNDGAGEQLTHTYAQQVGDEVRTLLK